MPEDKTYYVVQYENGSHKRGRNMSGPQLFLTERNALKAAEPRAYRKGAKVFAVTVQVMYEVPQAQKA